MAEQSLTATRTAGFSLSRRAAIGVSLFAAVALTALAAQVRVGGPVPFTLQTLVVLLSGALLGPVWGPAAMAGYLLLGGVGLPLFTSATLFGTTFGYLVGFVAASWLIGRIVWSVEKPGLIRCQLAMVAGAAVVLFLGMAHLAWVLGFGVEKAFMVGVAPFVVGEVIKIALALSIWGAAYRPLRRKLEG